MSQTATDTGWLELLDLVLWIGFGLGVFILCISLVFVSYRLFMWIDDTLDMAAKQVKKNRRER